MLPSATATPGSTRTSSSRLAENGGGMTNSSSLPKADLPVMTASVPAYTDVKMLLNALSIVSVRT